MKAITHQAELNILLEIELKKQHCVDFDKVKQLLNSGAKPCVKGKLLADNSIQIALSNNASSEIIELLFEHGAEIHNSFDGNSSLDQALYWGCDYAVIKTLFQYGAKVTNSKNTNDFLATSLHLAIYHDHSFETIEELLNNGASLITQSSNPYATTISFSLRKNVDLEILNLFKIHDPNYIKQSDRNGSYCLVNQLLNIASHTENNGFELKQNLSFLLNAGARTSNGTDDNTINLALSKTKAYEIFQLLFDNGAKITNNPKSSFIIAKQNLHSQNVLKLIKEHSPINLDHEEQLSDLSQDSDSESVCSDFNYKIR